MAAGPWSICPSCEAGPGPGRREQGAGGGGVAGKGLRPHLHAGAPSP